MTLSHIASRVFDTPLLISEGKACAFLAGLGGRLVDGGVSFPSGIPVIEHVAFQDGRASMGKLGDKLGRMYDGAGLLPFDVVENVAVIGVEGTLVHKGAFLGQSSGTTSYQGIQTQVARAKRSDKIKAVVFEIDSFGGEGGDGVFEAAADIASLSKLKPTLAICTSNACSAAYLLAAASRQIVATTYGSVGSIGALSLHLDLSEAAKKEGIKVTIIKSGAKKTDGNKFEPLSEEYAARMQANVDAQREAFAAAVGKYRGPRITKAKAMATEGDHFKGEEALALGLADAVARGSTAFDAFIRAVNRA